MVASPRSRGALPIFFLVHACARSQAKQIQKKDMIAFLTQMVGKPVLLEVIKAAQESEAAAAATRGHRSSSALSPQMRPFVECKPRDANPLASSLRVRP